MIVQQDHELLPWALGISHNSPVPPGDFLRYVADAAFMADNENYEILRPALLKLKAKYPQYHLED